MLEWSNRMAWKAMPLWGPWVRIPLLPQKSDFNRVRQGVHPAARVSTRANPSLSASTTYHEKSIKLMKYTIITAIIIIIIASLGLIDNPNKKISLYKIILTLLLISLPVLSIFQAIEERKLQPEQVTQIQLDIRMQVDSHDFEAFRNYPDIQKDLKESTYLKSYGLENNLSFGEKSFEAYYLLRKIDVQNIIKQHVFNELKLRLYCESKDEKSWIDKEFNGPDKIGRILLISTEFKDGIYYYEIGVEYKVDIESVRFKTLKGFNETNCKITLETPKDFKTFKDLENEKGGKEYMHIWLLGPDSDFLADAYFKSKITRPPSHGRSVVYGEIEIPESFYKDYISARGPSN